MGPWNYYFIAKLGLFGAGYIGLHQWENLLFAALLLIPLPNRSLRIARIFAAIPLAVLLLYHDSRLPPISRLWSQWSALLGFSGDYLLELAGRLVNPRLIGALVGFGLVAASLGMRFRLTSLVLLGLTFAPLSQPTPGWFSAAFSPASAPDCAPASGSPSAPAPAVAAAPQSDADLNKELQSFYTDQARREVTIPRHPPDGIPFDILFIHVCSLAWDDIAYVHDNHPLLQHFNVLFSRFNSAATYSGPASLRVLRSSCGQTKESALYDPAPAPCYLFRALTAAGYTTNTLLNHDGNYEGFLQNLGRLGGLDAPALGNLGARTNMRAFYGSPIYDDYDILSRWAAQRAALPPGLPVALYYNTISLHDGNKVPGKESLSSLETFKFRLDDLFGDLERFLGMLEAAKRPTVVVFVPEHGAALRGETTQIAGMREIPSPSITRVPVGIAFIGLPETAAFRSQIRVDKPTSYLALSTLLAELVTHNPYRADAFDWQAQLDQLPDTPFVAENEKTVMMQIGPQYFMRTPDQSWIGYQAPP